MSGNDWGGLDDEFEDVSDQVVEPGEDMEDENVEYVGVVEETGGESMGRTPVQVPRGARVVQPVRMQPGARRPYAPRRAAPVQKVYREREIRDVPVGSVEVQIPTGSFLRFNEEAQQAMRSAPSVDIDGHAGRRVRPGMYVMMSGDDGMGTNGDAAPRTTTTTRTSPAWLTALTSIADATADIVGSGFGYANRRDEQNLAAQQAAAELAARVEAERAARGTAAAEATRQHAETMATLQQRQAELEALRQTEADTAAAREAAAANQAAAGQGGTSTVVWVSLAVLGVAGVGTLVYFLTRKK
jgi:hypothetical protein